MIQWVRLGSYISSNYFGFMGQATGKKLLRTELDLSGGSGWIEFFPDRIGASFTFKKKVNLMNSTMFVLFDKYCSIVDQLGSKDSSRDFQLTYVISYFFTYI